MSPVGKGEAPAGGKSRGDIVIPDQNDKPGTNRIDGRRGAEGLDDPFGRHGEEFIFIRVEIDHHEVGKMGVFAFLRKPAEGADQAGKVRDHCMDAGPAIRASHRTGSRFRGLQRPRGGLSQAGF